MSLKNFLTPRCRTHIDNHDIALPISGKMPRMCRVAATRLVPLRTMKSDLRRVRVLHLLWLLACGCAVEQSLHPALAANAANEAPTITKHPANAVGKRLGSVNFVVVASGSKPLTYQWYRDGKAWPGWTKPTLVLEGLSENDVGTYTVTISNAAGSVTSEGARLTLAGSPPPPPKPAADPKPNVTPPVAKTTTPSTPATLPPTAEDAVVGQSVKFAATADGSPPFKFQWLKNGKPISGATTALFAIPSARLEDAGLYVCIVSNAAGSSPSEPVNLVVRKP